MVEGSTPPYTILARIGYAIQNEEGTSSVEYRGVIPSCHCRVKIRRRTTDVSRAATRTSKILRHLHLSGLAAHAAVEQSHSNAAPFAQC